MEEVKTSSQEQNLQGGIILEAVRKMRENKELVDLAADLQVKRLTDIVPADIISNSESCSVLVDIKMENIKGEVLPQKKVRELIEGDKDVNHNGGVEMSYTKEENIYVTETGIVVNAIGEYVEGQQDENDNGTNVIIEVADILDHIDDSINNVEGDREDDPLDLEDNKRSHKAKFELLIVTGSEKRDGTSEQHRIICSKMAKVGRVKEFRRYLCRDCEITGDKDFIYGHIAEEHVHVVIHNENEGHMNDMICGSDEIIPKVPSATELKAVPSSTEIQVSFTKVGNLESSEAKRNESINQIFTNPKKRKVVTFSPNDPEVFFYEREDKTYFKKRRPSGAENEDTESSGGENEDTEGGRVNTQSEDTVNAHKENKASAGMKLLAGGIMSFTQQGCRVQDKPQQINDLDKIQNKYENKKIIKVSQKLNVERKVKKKRS